MIVNYSDEEVKKGGKSIFLAGPTPRDKDVSSWRPEAIRILSELGFDGTVYVPEREFDDRSFDYLKQYWWEREALHNASAIVFWIPRNVKTMPAFTTNAEYGKYTAINIDKVVYGRPDNSEKIAYFDLDYYVESEENYSNTLTDTLKKAMEIADKRKDMVDLDSYELNIIKRTIEKYPEIMDLVGEVHFSPENYGNKNASMTYGRYFFPDAASDDLKEFDRTILSVLLYHYLIDNRYEKFVEVQGNGDNKLTRENFDKIRNFMLTNFNTKEKKELLTYYMVINDLGKSKKVIEKLKAKGVESVDHDLLLSYLLHFDMLPALNKFSEESKKALINVLNNGINVGQYIQGECVDYSFNKVLNLNNEEMNLMLAEAILDIGGVRGHFGNLKGSESLNQSTVNNLLLATKVLSTCKDQTKIFNEFLGEKANQMHINSSNPKVRKAVTRICQLLRLYRQEDVYTVESEIVNNYYNYSILIDELNKTGYGDTAILPYYAPALLSNARSYYENKGSVNPIVEALRTCLPFIERVMVSIREEIGSKEEGIITVMLGDAAKKVTEDPTLLDNYDIEVLNDNEVILKEGRHK